MDTYMLLQSYWIGSVNASEWICTLCRCVNVKALDCFIILCLYLKEWCSSWEKGGPICQMLAYQKDCCSEYFCLLLGVKVKTPALILVCQKYAGTFLKKT